MSLIIFNNQIVRDIYTTVLYYQETQVTKIYPNGYEIDGVPQPLGELATGIWHLEHISNERPEYDTTTQFATYEWLPDYTTNQYVQVWTIHDRDDEQLIEHLTKLGENAVQSVKNRIAQQEINVKYQQNLATIAELGDEDAMEVKDQYPPFNPNAHPYVLGERFYYPVDGKLYKVISDHTSQPDWLPNTAVSLYEHVYVAPPGDLCDTAEAWNSANWGSYTVGYIVKHNNGIYEAKNTTHTWIAPAKTGDGAISWTWIKDC